MALLAAATAGMLARVEPFATWYYPFAWYSTLVLVDAAVARRDGRFFLLERPLFALSLFGWSVPFWLFFELLNLRLANWYYVFVPDHHAARWIGITISFATVLPAIFLSERALRSWGPWRVGPEGAAGSDEPRDGPSAIEGRRLGGSALAGLQVAGLLCLVLPLVWPRWLFPLVWIGVALVADPWVYRRDPQRSLIRDLERGRPNRPIRLLVGGMAIGLLWELFNVGARGKWIYTVPGLEELKLFEMPLLGFFGFPFLALDGWAAYQALVVAGLAVGSEGDRTPSRRAGVRHGTAAGALAALFSAAVLLALERGTISSYTPRLGELGIGLRGGEAARLAQAGYDLFAVAGTTPGEIAARAEIDREGAEEWVRAARLAALRGIGTANARSLTEAGVPGVEELAAADPAELARRLASLGRPVRSARVRVWVGAARAETGYGRSGSRASNSPVSTTSTS